MSYVERMESLKAKKELLEEQLRVENKRPVPDYTKVTMLKREKLRIKDELELLTKH